MKLNIRNRKNVIASLAKQSMTFVALVWVLLSLVFFVACSDFGDRNNPLDPGAGNYVAQNDDSKSSSSSVILSSSEESSTSRSSSSTEEQKFSSSSKIFEPAEGPSSSSIKDEFSSSSIIPDSVPTSVSSSSNKASSSSDVVFPSSSENLRSSSSSEEQSFSSSSKISEPVEMSSSSLIPWLCGNSTLTRGDYEYKTVVIKEQCWTKENLRYVPSTGHTMCYGDKKENCEIYGRLYDYEAASLACPTGWRLPTSAEYEALAEYSMEGVTLYDAGAHFKSTSGWTPENGDDFLEFTALPGGKCNEDQTCQNIGTMGYWWTSTEKVKNTSHLALALNGEGDSYSATNKMDNDQYISVRCVKK